MATSIPNLDKFCEYLMHERRVSDYTVRNYRAAVENFVVFDAPQAKNLTFSARKFEFAAAHGRRKL